MKPTIDEILASGVGGSPFEMMLLRTAASKKGSRPLRSWRTCQLYERLIERGLVEERPDDNPHFRHFVATDAGRRALDGVSDE